MSSPSSQKVLGDFVAKFPTTRVYAYDLFNDENRRRAWQRCYGTSEIPVIAWEKAEVILALESDFLGTEGSTIEQIRKFAGARDIMKSSAFNRLYCVEGAMSLTGANAGSSDPPPARLPGTIRGRPDQRDRDGERRGEDRCAHRSFCARRDAEIVCGKAWA